MSAGVEGVMDQISTAELLGRIDERTQNTSQAVTALDVKIDGFGDRIGRVETLVDGFSLVRRVVFGAVGFILIAVLGALVALVVYTPN